MTKLSIKNAGRRLAASDGWQYVTLFTIITCCRYYNRNMYKKDPNASYFILCINKISKDFELSDFNLVNNNVNYIKI